LGDGPIGRLHYLSEGYYSLVLTLVTLVETTDTRIPDPPFSSFDPSRDNGMDLCLEVYL
jgi:hypothetical protein